MRDDGGLLASHVVMESAIMRATMTRLERIAATDAALLLWGETGTGKDFLARRAHAASPRAARVFVPVDCGALPETARATAELISLVEWANGGTLFLDAVAELSLPLQVGLARILEGGRVRRHDESRERPVDVRLIASTNRDLWAMVQEGLFRAELFGRLNIAPVRLPALRDRGPDLPLLVQRLLDELNAHNQRACRITDAAVGLLAEQVWPGNVLELRNFLEQLVVLSDDQQIDRRQVLDALGEVGEAGEAAPATAPGRSRRALPTPAEVKAALLACGGNKREAARRLGISPQTLYLRMRQFDP